MAVFKIKKLGSANWRVFRPQIKYSHKEYSLGSATDGLLNIFGRFFYAILNVNGDKRNVNVNENHPDDKWNENYRVLVR